MNVAELARWLAAHRPAPARVVAIVEGSEAPLKIAGGTHRWSRAAKLISELNAEAVRLYDKSGELVDSCALQQNITDVDAGVVAAASSSSGKIDDTVRIINVVAEAFARVARDATAAQAEAHSTAFKELTRVTEVATSRLVSLEQFVHTFLQQRSAEVQQRAAELEAREAELEEAEDTGVLDQVMAKLADKITSKQSGDAVADAVKEAAVDQAKKTNGANGTHEAGANGARKK